MFDKILYKEARKLSKEELDIAKAYIKTNIKKIQKEKKQKSSLELELESLDKLFRSSHKRKIYLNPKKIARNGLILLILGLTVFKMVHVQKAEAKFLQTNTISVQASKQLKQSVAKETQEVKKKELTDIAMPKEHQEYLKKLCQQRGLDYKKTLALIRHESNFNPRAVSQTRDYGYFQINISNHKSLAKTLNTKNDPLDPYINMNWGTYLLKNLYDYWRNKGLTGSKLDEAVLSSYNRGINGYKKYGVARQYVARYQENYKVLWEK